MSRSRRRSAPGRRGAPSAALAAALAAAAWAGALMAALPAAAEPGAAPAMRTGAPIPVRNLTPVTVLFGLPRPLGGLPAAGATELTLRLEHANNFTAAGSTGDAAAVFDGTTSIAGVGLRGRLNARLEWGVEVPWVRHSGGFTDGLIEGFHDLFGFPDGGRNRVPRDRLDYRLWSDGVVRAEVDDATGRLGDIRGWLGYRFHEGAGRQAMLRAGVKAPTGRMAELTGSEGTDLALALELVDERTLQDLGVTLTAMAAATALGGDALPGTPQEELVWSGHVGMHYPLGRHVTLHAQLDGHGRLIDTGLRQFAGATLQGTLGGTVALTSGHWLDVGVSEDLTGASAPDVVFLLSFGARL